MVSDCIKMGRHHSRPPQPTPRAGRAIPRNLLNAGWAGGGVRRAEFLLFHYSLLLGDFYKFRTALNGSRLSTRRTAPCKLGAGKLVVIMSWLIPPELLLLYLL